MESPPSRPRSGGGEARVSQTCHAIHCVVVKKEQKAPKIGDVLPLVDGNVWASVISRLDRPTDFSGGDPVLSPPPPTPQTRSSVMNKADKVSTARR